MNGISGEKETRFTDYTDGFRYFMGYLRSMGFPKKTFIQNNTRKESFSDLSYCFLIDGKSEIKARQFPFV